MTTKLKAANGEGMIIANSAFKKVVNYSINNTVHYINIDVAYDTDIDKLEKCLKEMTSEVEKIDGYVGNYKLLGIFTNNELNGYAKFTNPSNTTEYLGE